MIAFNVLLATQLRDSTSTYSSSVVLPGGVAAHRYATCGARRCASGRLHSDGDFVLELHGLTVKYRCLRPECASDRPSAIGVLPPHVTSTSLDIDHADLTEFDPLAPTRVVGSLRQRAAQAAQRSSAAVGRSASDADERHSEEGADNSGALAARRWFREYGCDLLVDRP